MLLFRGNRGVVGGECVGIHGRDSSGLKRKLLSFSIRKGRGRKNWFVGVQWVDLIRKATFGNFIVSEQGRS